METSLTIAEPTLMTFAVSLFTIANPIGTVPVFLALTEGRNVRQQRRTAMLVGIGAFVVLVVALVAGTWILRVFGIDLTAFRIAGFAFVATIAWGMMVTPSQVMTSDGSSPAIVPLALPVIAGPGAMALMISFASRFDTAVDYLIGVAVALVVSGLTVLIYSLAPQLQKVLGPTGMNVFTRVFGLILLAICVQAFLVSLTDAFPGLVRG